MSKFNINRGLVIIKVDLRWIKIVFGELTYQWFHQYPVKHWFWKPNEYYYTTWCLVSGWRNDRRECDRIEETAYNDLVRWSCNIRQLICSPNIWDDTLYQWSYTLIEQKKAHRSLNQLTITYGLRSTLQQIIAWSFQIQNLQ